MENTILITTGIYIVSFMITSAIYYFCNRSMQKRLDDRLSAQIAFGSMKRRVSIMLDHKDEVVLTSQNIEATRLLMGWAIELGYQVEYKIEKYLIAGQVRISRKPKES